MDPCHAIPPCPAPARLLDFGILPNSLEPDNSSESRGWVTISSTYIHNMYIYIHIYLYIYTYTYIQILVPGQLTTVCWWLQKILLPNISIAQRKSRGWRGKPLDALVSVILLIPCCIFCCVRCGKSITEIFSPKQSPPDPLLESGPSCQPIRRCSLVSYVSWIYLNSVHSP